MLNGPAWDESYLVENEVQLTVSFNGKARFQMTFPADCNEGRILRRRLLEDERSQHYIDGKTIVKIIVVPKKIINIVCK